MKVIHRFLGIPVGLTRAYRYQVVHQETLGRVQLWYNAGDRWELGHGKRIPEGLDANHVAMAMESMIRGGMSPEEYNLLVPAA